MVEKSDLLGLDYLWEVCLHIPDESIADSAIQLLLNMSYNNLNPRLKKVRVKGACACVCFIVFVLLMLHSYTHKIRVLHMECMGSQYLVLPG